jgi:excinuclease UvrABC nuclease subunit
MSIEFEETDGVPVTTNGGVYLLINSQGTILYVGKANNLSSRVGSHRRGTTNTHLSNEITKVRYLENDCPVTRSVLEMVLMARYTPQHNSEVQKKRKNGK